MTTGARPAAAEGAAGAPAEGTEPKGSAIQQAAAAAIEAINKRKEALNNNPADPAKPEIEEPAEAEPVDETLPADDTTAAEETPEETAAREAAEAEATAELRVKLPGARAEDAEIEIEVGDKETAEALNRLKKGYARREQAEAIREEAQQHRERAEEIELMVALDPTSFLDRTITEPRDKMLLFQRLATEPGLLEAAREWIESMFENPNEIQNQRYLVNAKFIERKDKASERVAEERDMRQNARQLVQTARKTIDTFVPHFDDDAKALLFEDVIQDTRQWARANNQVKVDPRVIPSLVQRRLKLLGVAPKPASESTATGKSSPGTPAKGTATTTQTAAALKKARALKAGAASAPPGAGSQVGSPMKPPAYDPKDKRSAIRQAADWALGRANRGKAPQ